MCLNNTTRIRSLYDENRDKFKTTLLEQEQAELTCVVNRILQLGKVEYYKNAAIDDLLERYPNVQLYVEMKYELMKSLLSILISDIRNKKLKSSDFIHPLLKQLAENPSTEMLENESYLLCVLSLLERKQFDYLVHRYFLLEKVEENQQLERSIQKIFEGKGRAHGYFVANQLIGETITSDTYIIMMSKLPDFFIEQIPRNSILQMHSICTKHSLHATVANHTYRRLQILLALVPCMILLIILFFVFYY